MPTPSPGIDELMRTPQFGGAPRVPLPAPRRPAAAPAPTAARFGRQTSPTPPPQPPASAGAPPDLDTLLAMIGLGPAPSAAPTTVATPRQPMRSRAAEDLIAKAIADPASETKPLFLSADRLDELGIDAADLDISLAHLGLPAVSNFDGRGGMLLARSPGILESAERLKKQGQPVPIVPVMPAVDERKKGSLNGEGSSA